MTSILGVMWSAGFTRNPQLLAIVVAAHPKALNRQHQPASAELQARPIPESETTNAKWIVLQTRFEFWVPNMCGTLKITSQFRQLPNSKTPKLPKA